MGNHGAPSIEGIMDFKNLELLYCAIVQYDQVKRRVINGETVFLHLVADTFRCLKDCVDRFRHDLRKLDRKYGRGKFAQYRKLERILTADDPAWNDCLPLLEDMAIHHPDGDEPVEVRISNR